MKEKRNAEQKNGDKKHRVKDNITALFLPRYRSMIFTFLYDCAFAVLSFYLARVSMFYKVDFPTNYLNFEVPLAIVMITVVISMLVLFDCYNVVWKYAGRVEFLKFICAYFVSFILLLIVKAIVAAAFNVD